MGASPPSDGWATPSDWATHRPLITRLYSDQNKTLKETMRVMEEKHAFYATVRMYKARFQQWRIEKKIKAEDAVEIFRQLTARAKAGKRSVAFIRGRKVNLERLQRYRYRAAAIVSEQILRAENDPVDFTTEISPSSPSSDVHVRTPSPSPSPSPSPPPEDRPTLFRRLEDPTDLRVPRECMQILSSYIAGSVRAGVWQVTSTTPVPDAFTWAHYLATSQGLIAHNRTHEGFILVNICFEQYKSHLLNPDPFFWLATYKAALLLAVRDTRLGDMFIKYASQLTAVMLPRAHPFNRAWSRINMTGLRGLQQHAAALFESYLNSWKEEVGLLPENQTTLVQMAFVFIQLRCSGMISDAFAREIMPAMMRLLSRSVYRQFLLQEAKFRMACLYLEKGLLDDADATIREILSWVDPLQNSGDDEFVHLRCKCLWTMFEIEDRKGNIGEAAQIGYKLVDLCVAVYGPTHLQTLDAISAVESFYTRNNKTAIAQQSAKRFNDCWTSFSRMAQRKKGFPHAIEHPWLYRSVELTEDQQLIEQVVDLLERSSWLDER